MIKSTKVVSLLLICISMAAAAATPAEEAQGLLDAAAAEVKTVGFDTAIKNFNGGGKWHKNSLYVVVTQFDGLTLAHSAYEKMPGKNMLEAKDASGKQFLKEAIAAARTSGSGQVSMRWPHPQTKQITDAVFFFKRIEGREALVGSVIFK